MSWVDAPFSTTECPCSESKAPALPPMTSLSSLGLMGSFTLGDRTSLCWNCRATKGEEQGRTAPITI